MILEDRIDNRTSANVRVFPTEDASGAEVALVVVRLAFAYARDGRLALASRPVRISDDPDGQGGILYPTDFQADKPGTDLGLVGHLEVPKRSVGEVVAGLRMGALYKGLRVTGPSHFELQQGRAKPSAPTPIVDPVPLVYALCLGGRTPQTIDPDARTASAENPVGRGFGAPSAWVGKPAPRLFPFGSTDGPAEHACFAPLPATWEPRASRAGTYDGTWARTRAPLAPLDRDARYGCWATTGLYSQTPLRGDEPIFIGGVHGASDLRLELPLHPVRISATVLGHEADLRTHLDGVLVDADRQVVELTWRAALRAPKKRQMIGRIRVETERDLSPEIADLRIEGHPEPGVQP